MAKNIFEPMMAKLKADPKKIVFTEGTDERILEASSRLLQDGFLTPVLVGKVEEVKAAAEKFGFDITGAEIVDPDNFDKFDEMVELFCELRKKKGVTPEQAKERGAADERGAGDATPMGARRRRCACPMGEDEQLGVCRLRRDLQADGRVVRQDLLREQHLPRRQERGGARLGGG